MEKSLKVDRTGVINTSFDGGLHLQFPVFVCGHCASVGLLRID